MDVRAILLLGAGTGTGEFANAPLGLLDVLGRPLVQRISDRLKAYGISNVKVVGDPGPERARLLPSVRSFDFVTAAGSEIWRTAQRLFSQHVQSGAEMVVLARVGPYVELDYGALLHFHSQNNGRVTAVTDPADQPLDTFVIGASRRNDAAFLLRHDLRSSRGPVVAYRYDGYCNSMQTAADLRRLAVDAFCGRAAILPEGEQVRPGVWAAAGARIQPGARVLAPAFIGRQVRVRAAAVVTRCAVVEHHADIGAGTVLEDATVLPCTAIGAGLDISHGVVGFGRVANLRRSVEVEITDPKLVGWVQSAPMRALSHAAALLTFIPWHFFRGIARPNAGAPELPAAANTPAAALTASESLPVSSARE